MRRKRSPVMNIGISSILSVFIILAMITFATLAYMTSRKDMARTEQLLSASVQSSEVTEAAERRIAEIGDVLAARYGTAAYEAELEKEYTFTVPGADDTELAITLVPRSPTADNPALYTITRYQRVVTTTWQGDDTLSLYGSDEFSIQ